MGDYARNPEYNKRRVTERRRQIKLAAIAYKGGKCQICGYNKSIRALSFHHVDPNEKGFGLARSGHTRSWERVKAELDKCVLLCANCHMEVEDGITPCPVAQPVEQQAVTLKVLGSSPSGTASVSTESRKVGVLDALEKREVGQSPA